MLYWVDCNGSSGTHDGDEKSLIAVIMDELVKFPYDKNMRYQVCVAEFTEAYSGSPYSSVLVFDYDRDELQVTGY